MPLWTLLLLLELLMAAFAQEYYCRQGTYGNNCELKCPDQCRPFQTFPCDKITGQCSEGCNNGYFGNQCDKKCSCPSGICYQQTGDCFGIAPGTATAILNMTDEVSSTTASPVHTNGLEGVAAGWRTIAIILIVFIIFLVCAGVIVFLCLRPKKHENRNTANYPLLEEATEGQSAKPKSHGGASGENPTEEELKQQIPHLKEEKECAEAQCEDMENNLSDLEYRKKGLLEERCKEMETQLESIEHQKNCAEDKCKEMKRKNSDLEYQKKRLEERCKKMEIQLESLDHQDKENQRLLGLPTNSKNYLMDNDEWLQCPNLKFDEGMVNVKVAQVDYNKVLWNISDTRDPGDIRKRFQQFYGTTCAKPLVKSGFYQYFEAVFDIRLKHPIEEGDVVMQLGFCREKDRDKTQFIKNKKKCFLVEVVSCKIHNKICLMVDKTEHIQEVMDNVEGSKQRLIIGICLDKDMKRMKVYDGIEPNVLGKKDICIGETIWPMFGVCDERNASVQVQLKAGSDIEMGNKKKEKLRPDHM